MEALKGGDANGDMGRGGGGVVGDLLMATKRFRLRLSRRPKKEATRSRSPARSLKAPLCAFVRSTSAGAKNRDAMGMGSKSGLLRVSLS